MAKGPTLTGLLKKAASDFPDRTAISVRGEKFEFHLMYPRLLELVDHAAELLAAYGVVAWDVVALAFPSTVEFVIMFLAVIRCRAAAAPLNPAYKAEEFEVYLSDLKVKLLLTPNEGNQPAQSAASKLNIPHLTAELHSANSKITLSSTDRRPSLDLVFTGVNDPSDVALFLLHRDGSRCTKGEPVTQKDLAAAVGSFVLNCLWHKHEFVEPLISYTCLAGELLSSLVAGRAVVLPAAARSSASRFTADMISGDATRHTADNVARVRDAPNVARPYQSNDMPEGNNEPKTTEENKTETKRGGEEANLEEALANLGGTKKYSYQELRIATNYFAKELGRGASGIVYKGHIGEARTPVAVKEITYDAGEGIEVYKSEVKSLSQLRHRNLVQLLGYCHEAKKFVLVYEFVGGGTLYHHLFGGGPLLTWTRRYNIARGLASALYYLHKQCHECVIHRDIKSSNVMLDEKFEAKLGDFGLAKLVDHTRDPSMTQPKGTPGYLDPEYFQTGIASKESDIYSFGVVLLEIGCGRKAVDQERDPPHLVKWVWKQYGPRKLLHAVDEKLGKDYDGKKAEALMIMGLQCAHPIASSRPSTESIMAVLNSTAKPPKLPSKMPGF